MSYLTTRVLAASIVILVLCLFMQQRLLNILGSSPLVGKLHGAYFRTFASTGMSRHTVFKDGEGVFNHGAFTVQPIPVLEDNYAYLLVDTASKAAALIDPAEPELAIAAVKQHTGLNLTHVLTTHKHWDHAQGNTDVAQQYPHVKVVGGEIDQVTACTQPVKHNDELTIGTNTRVRVHLTPCHTRGHVLYHVTSSSGGEGEAGAGAGAVFTGDTLFIAGSGRFFEGTAAQMHHNLNTVIAGLPADTAVYCGHEYTQANLEFAAWVEPSNAAVKEKLAWARQRRQDKQTTLATTVGEEQKINPFMRVKEPEVRERVSRWLDKNVDGDDAVRVMAAVREAKNQNAHKQSANL